jgi:hypothetical protein
MLNILKVKFRKQTKKIWENWLTLFGLRVEDFDVEGLLGLSGPRL